MDNIFTVVSTIITGAIALIGIYLKISLNKKCDPVTEQNAIDQNVMAALEYLRNELDADRVIVQEFHNGGKFTSGCSQKKLSVSYEVCKNGVSSIFRKFQNVRVSALSSILKRSFNNLILVNLNKEECAFSHDLKEHGTISSAFCVLKTLTNKNIGLLSIQYVNRPKHKFTEQQNKCIQVQTLIISGYLVSHKLKT